MSTRYRLFSMVIVRSCESLLRGTLGGAAAAIAAGVAGAFEPGAAGGVEAAAPELAGAVCTGRFACGWTDGFGPKYFAQTRITTMESSDATRIRSSGVNLSFCPGTLKNAPHGDLVRSGLRGFRLCRAHVLARRGSNFPEQDHSQTCAKAVGTAAAASQIG